MSKITPSSTASHEPYQPLSSHQLPLLQEERENYAYLVKLYITAPNSRAAEEVNEKLIQRYKIDLGLREYKGCPLPGNATKKVESMAMIAFTLFEMDRSKEINQSSLYSLSGCVLTKVFARTIMLMERAIEVIRALSPGTQAGIQKSYFKKAEALYQSAEIQFKELENRIGNSALIITLLKESYLLLIHAEKAFNKSSFSEADFYLLEMSDKIRQIQEKSQGIFYRLLESMKAGKKSSYDFDLQDVKSIRAGLDKCFIDYDQRVFQRAPWQSLKTEVEMLQKKEQQAEASKESPGMEASLFVFDLRLIASYLDQKLIGFLMDNVENTFDSA